MRKFGAYPIMVNYNLHTRLRNDYKEGDFHRAGRYEDERQLYIRVATSSDAAIDNNLYSQELNEYEQTVCGFLRQIEGNPVGRMVLGLLNKNTTVWIVPKSDEELKLSYSAMTGPLKYEIEEDGSYARGSGSGDTVILFHPKLGDSTLLHELVHAYRYSIGRFAPVHVSYNNGYSSHTTTSEEILAHVIENLYLSEAKRTLILDYVSSWDADKDETYDVLVKNHRLLRILEYFLRHEYLALMAARTFKSTEYNPFRDYAKLEAASLKTPPLALAPELDTTLGP